MSVDPVTNEVYAGECTALCGGTASSAISYFLGSTTGTTDKSLTVTGLTPWNVAVNPVTNTVYVADWDTQAGEHFSGAVGAGGNAGTVTEVAQSEYMWLLGENSITNQVLFTGGTNASDAYVLNSAMAGSIATATGTTPYGVSLDPITNHAYTVNEGAATSTDIDLNSYTAQTGVSTGTTPVALAINPASGVIYTVNSGSASVSAFSSATPPVATSGSPISVGTTPVALAVDPVTSSVYVVSNGATPGTMTVIDENSGDPNATASVTVGNGPAAVAVNPVTNKVYVANKTDGTVSVYNENTGTVVATIPLSPATGPYAIAIDQTNNTIYVADASGNVSEISGSANTLTRTITTASQTGATNLQAIAVNPVTHNV
jgi:YVTN family beta-propeller protein